MTNYIPADELKAEIKIIQQSLESRDVRSNRVKKIRTECMIEFCKCIFEVIDSLQQEQPIQVNTLTWRDINDLERIINNVHYEFRNGIGEKSFGEEVFERFREERDEQEQPEVDLEEERETSYYDDMIAIARRCCRLGLNARNEE